MANTHMPEHKLPLDDLRIVEYGGGVAGPYGAKLLGDAGAEVIKVEPPEGDELRRPAYSYAEEEEHSREGLFQFLNTNKRSVTLDARDREGRRLLDLLLRDADILIWGGPPRLARSLRLHYRYLQKANPRLIVTSITPFGLTGPYRNFRGGEFIVYNLGALAYSTPGFPDHVNDPRREPPLHPRTHVGDFITGKIAAVATLMAVFARERDGQGRHVDVSGLEAVAAMMLRDVSNYSFAHAITGRLPGPSALMPNTLMPCKDGWVVVATPYEHQWKRLVEVLGNPEWASLEVFSNGFQRAANWDALRPLLEEWTMAHTGQEIMTMTQPRGIPCFPAFRVGDMMGSAQMRERAFFWEVPADGEKVNVPGPLFKMAETPLSLRRPAPAVGQHNQEVWGRLGLSPSDITQLRAQGVV